MQVKKKVTVLKELCFWLLQ